MTTSNPSLNVTTYTNLDPDQTVIACHADDDLSRATRILTNYNIGFGALYAWNGMNRFQITYTNVDPDQTVNACHADDDLSRTTRILTNYNIGFGVLCVCSVLGME